MKKIVFIFASVLLMQMAKAQDSLKHYELGVTLGTINSFNPGGLYGSNKPSTEILNNLFFRYSYKRFGFRSQIGYSENSQSYSINQFSHYSINRDFRAGVGAQFNLLKKRDWLYTYADVLYRNVQTKGRYMGYSSSPENISYSKNTNGVDAFLGIGLKLKLSKNIFLSPEAGINTFFGKEKYASDFMPGTFTNQKYNKLNLSPVFKLHLTIKFK